MDIPKIDYFNASTITRRSLEKHYPGFVKYIDEHYTEGSWTEKLYWYYHGLTEFPKCVVCGQPVRFRSFQFGYNRTCCNKCTGLDPETKRKKEETSLKNNGVRYGMQSKEIQEKSKQTCLEKYGVSNVFAAAEIKKKIKETHRKRYGVDAPMQSKEIQEKSKQTCLKKYGTEHNTSNQQIKDKVRQTNIERYGGTGYGSCEIKHDCEQTCIDRYGYQNIKTARAMERHDDLVAIDGEDWVMKCPHPDCNKCDVKLYKITGDQYRARMSHNVEPCTTLLPIKALRSTQEIQICKWLDDIGVKHVDNSREFLNGKEIDIYLPNYKIGIECNGCYPHSDRFKSQKEHEWKFVKSREQGIQLLTIWDDWMKRTPDIVKSLIFSKFGIYEHRTGASKCKIRSVDKTTAIKFLEENHIQGRCGCSINYGLYYKDKLVSLMTFGKRRPGMGGKKQIEGQYELLRFCNLKGWQVVHGAERMLKHFIRDYNPKEIISFSSNDISDGKLYRILGFETDGKIQNAYWYIEPNTYKRYHRFSFNKYEIKRKGLAPDKEKWTEHEAMDAAGYHRIYDSGTTKWILKL